MHLCGVQRAVPLSSARQAQRQCPSNAQPAVRPGVLQPATRSSASRPIPSAPDLTVRTRAVPESATPWLTPGAVFAVVTLYGAGVFTIITSLQRTIKDSNSALERKLTASSRALERRLEARSRALERKLTASSSAIEVKLAKLVASSSVLKSEVHTISKKVEALSTSMQAQQLVQTALLQGEISALQEVVTGTTTPTASPPTPTRTQP